MRNDDQWQTVLVLGAVGVLLQVISLLCGTWFVGERPESAFVLMLLSAVCSVGAVVFWAALLERSIMGWLIGLGVSGVFVLLLCSWHAAVFLSPETHDTTVLVASIAAYYGTMIVTVAQIIALVCIWLDRRLS